MNDGTGAVAYAVTLAILTGGQMTIADIFDALTAADRPYKPAVPVHRALGILESEVKSGKCDADLFRVFVGAEIYKRVI